jgi:hypothetical protein
MRWLLALVLLTLALPAWAQDGDAASDELAPSESAPPPEPALTPYQSHMRNGIKLFKEGLWDGAIAEFEAAYLAEQRPSPLINAALTYKKLANPAKAIDVLEMALRKHRASMAQEQIDAAEREIREMRALLAYVSVQVTPAHATLQVDDHAQKDWSSGQVLALSPGTRTLRAEAVGFAILETKIKVISGHDNALVALELEPTHGEVIVTAQNSAAVIEVDGNVVARGLYKDMLRPGPHVIKVTHDKVEHSLSVQVAAGGRYTVTQSKDGELESDATAPLVKPKDEFGLPFPEILRGIYGTGSFAFLAAYPSIEGFEPNNDDRFGAAVGLHLGYRVADWAGFEGFGQYSDVRVSGKVPGHGEDVNMVLRSLRLGLQLRAMFPGRAWFRFLGTAGGGAMIEWLEWRGEPAASPIFLDEQGVGPFGQIDLGVEFELSQVLIDLLIQHTVQGTKHFDLDNERNAFGTKPMFLIGPSVRVGYGLW